MNTFGYIFLAAFAAIFIWAFLYNSGPSGRRKRRDGDSGGAWDFGGDSDGGDGGGGGD